jgi:hypothetical protein
MDFDTMTIEEMDAYMDNLDRVSQIMIEAQREVQPALDLASTLEALGVEVRYDYDTASGEWL